jgi:hypothetical protein
VHVCQLRLALLLPVLEIIDAHSGQLVLAHAARLFGQGGAGVLLQARRTGAAGTVLVGSVFLKLKQCGS